MSIDRLINELAYKLLDAAEHEKKAQQARQEAAELLNEHAHRITPGEHYVFGVAYHEWTQKKVAIHIKPSSGGHQFDATLFPVASPEDIAAKVESPEEAEMTS